MGFFSELFREFKKAKPVPRDPNQKAFEDPVYGHLDWDADPAWWVGTHTCAINGQFRLVVDPSEEQDRLPVADLGAFFASVRPLISSAKAMAVEYFLPTFNENWNEGAPLNAEQFSALLKPESVHVWEYGSVEVSFQDADDTEPLGGHSLVVSFNTDGTSTVGFEG